MTHFKLLNFGIILSLAYFTMGLGSCNFNNSKEEEKPEKIWDSLEVTASAYNSLSYQTGAGGANITAWGDTLKPGIQVIAVSRDLIQKGLDHNTPVKIEGFPGVFLVQDKMHHRWRNKIDIYMGEDVSKARQFGRKKLKIWFEKPADTIKNEAHK
ncbi:3D domain-containing protein [Salegentibacter sp. HM20]